MSEWQPVSTAPEGQCVLMWVDERLNEGRIGAVVGYVRNEYGRQYGYSVETGRPLHRVTHWKPIEAPGDKAEATR